MNTERLSAVADAIERGSPATSNLGFNMRDFAAHVDAQHKDYTGRAPTCGTVACIAGWAASLAAQSPVTPQNRYSSGATGIFNTARNYLGLTEEEADSLFYVIEMGGYADDAILTQITSAQAVAVLRHAAATGTIDWARVRT